MCATADRTMMEDVIVELTNKGDMFTAFDVTRLAQKRGMRERHLNVKNCVHNFWESGGFPADYKRQLVDVGAPDKAWLYYPYTSDPNTYQGVPNVPSISSVVPSIPKVHITTQTANDGANADKRGTVCVPARILTKIGLNKFDEAVVYADSKTNTVMIGKTGGVEPVSYDTKRKYTVDKNLNVRVTQHIFKIAGLPAGVKGTRYKVKIANDRVVIRF